MAQLPLSVPPLTPTTPSMSAVPLALPPKHKHADVFPEDKGVENIEELEGDYPAPSTLLGIEPSEALAVARDVLPVFARILCEPSATAQLVSQHWHPEGFWRDYLGFTWTMRTFHRVDVVRKALSTLVSRAKAVPGSFKIREEEVATIMLPNAFNFVRVPITFRIAEPAGECLAVLKLVRLKNGEIKARRLPFSSLRHHLRSNAQIFLMTTTLESLESAPWQLLPPVATRKLTELPKSTDILLVGASSAGLAAAGYFKSLNLDFVQVDSCVALPLLRFELKYNRIDTMGDSWALVRLFRSQQTTT